MDSGKPFWGIDAHLFSVSWWLFCLAPVGLRFITSQLALGISSLKAVGFSGFHQNGP